MAWTLCSKEDVQSLYRIDTASLQDFWSETVEALIREYLHAPYLGQSVTVTEYHSGDGSPILVVNHPPIISITELLVDGVSVPSSDYLIFRTFVALPDWAFLEGNFNIKITFVSGSVDVPKDVSLACATMIAAIANYEGRQGVDGTLKWGDLPAGIGEETTNEGLGLAGHLKTLMALLLRRYRVRMK